MCEKLEVYHAATNKLPNLRGLFVIDVLEFEVLKSFLFAHIANFDNSRTS